jgi:hypothetical protein
MVVSTLAALAAAALFALTTNLQRAAASSVPTAGSGPVHLLRRLITDRRWLAGGLIGGAALALHAVSLARGSVMVVQSVMALGLVIALAVEARREARPMRANELAGAALVVGGVATVVAVSHAAGPQAATSGLSVVVCAAVALLALAAVVRSRHHVGARWGSRLLAAAGGACFAVDAVFLQRLAALLDRGLTTSGSGVDVLSAAGDLTGFLGAAMIGTVAVHRAYQVAPLRVVQPALAAAEPVTAFVVGVAVLHEGVRGGVAGFVLLIVGLLAIIAGIFVGLLPSRAPRPVAVPAPTSAARPVSTPVSTPASTSPLVPAGTPAAGPRQVREPALVRLPAAVRVPVLAGGPVRIHEPGAGPAGARPGHLVLSSQAAGPVRR